MSGIKAKRPPKPSLPALTSLPQDRLLQAAMVFERERDELSEALARERVKSERLDRLLANTHREVLNRQADAEDLRAKRHAAEQVIKTLRRTVNINVAVIVVLLLFLALSTVWN